jgi:hypothetical protein
MGLKDWEEIDAATAALNQVGPFLEGTNYQHIVDELNQKVSLSSAKLGPRPIKGMGPPTAGGGNFFSPGSRGEALVQGYGEVMDKGKERYMKYGGPLPWAIKGIQAGGNYLQGPASEGMNPLAGMNPLPAIGGALQQIPTQPGMDIWGNPLPAGNTNIWQSPFKRRK